MNTDDKYLPTCDPQLTPMVSSRSNPFTPRRAIDSSGHLGSLYDACCDQVLPQSTLKFTPQSITSQRSSKCYVKTCDPKESWNLLKWYNMYNELRLSVTLQMVKEMGVGALINYSRPINQYTRFICYALYSSTDYISDDEFKSLRSNKAPMPDTLATDIIVMVNWGIDALAVLQLPPNDARINAIDHAIEKLCRSLSNDNTNIVLSENDERVLENIVHTDVFSNTPELCKIKSLVDFHSMIPRLKNNTNYFKPYNYNLCSVRSLYAVNSSKLGAFSELPLNHISSIELYLLPLLRNIQILGAEIEQGYPNLQKYLNDQLSEMYTEWSRLEQMYLGEIQRLRKLVIDTRCGKIEHGIIHEALNDDKKKELMKSIDSFQYDLNVMREKEHLIGDLLQRHFEYGNAIDFAVKNDDDKHVVERKLLSDDKYDRAICFNDILRNRNNSEWNGLITQFMKEHTENPQLRLIFIDFTYCSFELNNFIILRKISKSNNVIASKPTAASSLERPTNDGTINILLLGESGVGKSTFINAFANYLTFNTLENAENNPKVLIPVSFIMTVGDDFEEKLVTSGEMDTLSNENHEHFGQSVTQHCKSYVFTLQGDDNNRGRKLRIIDTPGIGDVRGLGQDDINMQHILLYMSNLTHLNAVCICLKPNNARLNNSFRSFFVQLFDFLGENARDQAIFCFTNARATFYTPGNTGPLLKQLLKSLPIQDIPFTKSNTFCFDSQAFRYLVAKQNGIKFSNSTEKDCKESWDRSSTESKRFLEYIGTKTTLSSTLGQYRSMKNAQLTINVMIRPILESMRNFLRNIVLVNARSHKVSIELRPQTIKDSTGICLACPRQPRQYGDFWIMPEQLHFFYNRCRSCDCSPSDHYTIDYQLEYRLCNGSGNNSKKELTKMLDDLCQASAEFSYVLVGGRDGSQNDLFLSGIERMIKEENDICKSKVPCEFNLNLFQCLEQLKKKYEETRKNLLANKGLMELSKIYDKIAGVSQYPMIGSQMSAAKEWYKFMMKHYEYVVPM